MRCRLVQSCGFSFISCFGIDDPKFPSIRTIHKEPTSQMQMSMGSSLRAIRLLHATASLSHEPVPGMWESANRGSTQPESKDGPNPSSEDHVDCHHLSSQANPDSEWASFDLPAQPDASLPSAASGAPIWKNWARASSNHNVSVRLRSSWTKPTGRVCKQRGSGPQFAVLPAILQLCLLMILSQEWASFDFPAPSASPSSPSGH